MEFDPNEIKRRRQQREQALVAGAVKKDDSDDLFSVPKMNYEEEWYVPQEPLASPERISVQAPRHPWRRNWGARWLVSLLLFVGLFLTFHSDSDLAKQAQLTVRNVLTKPIDVQAVSSWISQSAARMHLSLPAFSGAQSTYATPIAGPILRSYDATKHPGIDIAAAGGQSVFAMDSGMVMESGEDPQMGKYVTIDHGGNPALVATYAGLGEVRVRADQWVTKREVIGTIAAQSEGEEAHLHLAIRLEGKVVDPSSVLTNLKQNVSSQ
ncbi:MAG: M23 family metallopeptidase [Firmicutes bacterium]|nr:M23 family metallopeptidase [Bacillota bacterium]